MNKPFNLPNINYSRIQRINVLGIPFDRLTFERTVEICLKRINNSDKAHLLVGVNANNLILATNDPEYGEAIKRDYAGSMADA